MFFFSYIIIYHHSFSSSVHPLLFVIIHHHLLSSTCSANLNTTCTYPCAGTNASWVYRSRFPGRVGLYTDIGERPIPNIYRYWGNPNNHIYIYLNIYRMYVYKDIYIYVYTLFVYIDILYI